MLNSCFFFCFVLAFCYSFIIVLVYISLKADVNQTIYFICSFPLNSFMILIYDLKLILIKSDLLSYILVYHINF